MEDECALCQESICTATWNCGNNHRSCLKCYVALRKFARRNFAAFACPFCRAAVTKSEDSTDLQQGLSLQSARDNHVLVPVGPGTAGADSVAEEDVVRFVRQILTSQRQSMTSAGNAEMRNMYDDLRHHLRDLSMMEYELVFTELVKDVNLHHLLRNIDSKLYETKTEVSVVQKTVEYMFNDPNMTAVAARAGINTAGQVIAALFSGSVSKSLIHFTGMDAGLAAFTFVIFAVNELSRYRRGEISRTEALKNIGEHSVGAVCGTAGCVAGGMAGASIGGAVGSVVPVAGTALGAAIGTIIGAILGSFASDSLGRLAYRKVLPRIEKVEESSECEQQVLRGLAEVAAEAAEKLGINLQHHDFAEAKSRYRKMLLRNHPDRFQGQPEEVITKQHEKMLEILSSWSLVRLYYKEHPGVTAEWVQVESPDDAFILVNVLRRKVHECGQDVWKYVRCWFGDLGLGRDLDVEKEMITTMQVYV